MTPCDAPNVARLDARPWNILLVDDDADLRDGLCEWLEGEGFRVAVAGDGIEALGQVEHAAYDAIVCDLDMPRLRGIELVRRIRGRGHDLVVVLLSGRFDLLASARDLGQVYALGKPCSGDRLVNTLREALEERS